MRRRGWTADRLTRLLTARAWHHGTTAAILLAQAPGWISCAMRVPSLLRPPHLSPVPRPVFCFLPLSLSLASLVLVFCLVWTGLACVCSSPTADHRATDV